RATGAGRYQSSVTPSPSLHALPIVTINEAALAAHRHRRMSLVAGVPVYLVTAPAHVRINFFPAALAHFSFGTGGAHGRPSTFARAVQSLSWTGRASGASHS